MTDNDSGCMGFSLCVCVCVCRRYSANSPSLPDRLMTSLCFCLSHALRVPPCLFLLEMISLLAPPLQRLHLLSQIFLKLVSLFSFLRHHYHLFYDTRPSLTFFISSSLWGEKERQLITNVFWFLYFSFWI